MGAKKLRWMSPMSPESTAVRNYLDWLLSIPWAKRSRIKKDLKLAQEVLDNDHFSLEKVKERIVEYLAVQQRANKLTGDVRHAREARQFRAFVDFLGNLRSMWTAWWGWEDSNYMPSTQSCPTGLRSSADLA
jgi:hypothetical protein